MGDRERRKARRYEVRVPVQVTLPRCRPAEFYTVQLKDISRLGIFFHSPVAIEAGAEMQLTFALATEQDSGAAALVHASARVLRAVLLEGGAAPFYGIAATMDRIDLVRPVAATAAA